MRGAVAELLVLVFSTHSVAWRKTLFQRPDFGGNDLSQNNPVLELLKK
jgi:hypothetical protein